MFEQFRASFWNEHVWMPPNVTWELYESNGYRHFNDLYYSVYTAVILIAVRFFLER